jgi:hypothetical protein
MPVKIQPLSKLARFLLNRRAVTVKILAWVYRVNRYRYFSEKNQA